MAIQDGHKHTSRLRPFLSSLYSTSKVALGVVEAAADPLPPLKATIGGLLQVLKQIDVSHIIVTT